MCVECYPWIAWYEAEAAQIGSVFASLSGEKEVELPERFLHLKRYVPTHNRDNKPAGRLITRGNVAIVTC